MKLDRSKWWVYAFLAIPVLYFATQFLPYYHSGSTYLTSMWGLFWFPEENQETIDFIALFHHGFRVNDLVAALLITQLAALFLIIITLIKRNSGIVAFLWGIWGAFGLYSFLTTHALAFSPVMVYSGIAGILMLLLFLAAFIVSTLYLSIMYKKHRKILIAFKAEQSAQESPL